MKIKFNLIQIQINSNITVNICLLYGCSRTLAVEYLQQRPHSL